MIKRFIQLIFILVIIVGVLSYYDLNSMNSLFKIKNLDQYQLEQGKLIVNVQGKLVADYEAHKIQYVEIDKIPYNLRMGIVAVEDNRFFQHPALDPQGILRALYTDIKNGELTEGGSTITQQLAKNIFLTSDKTFLRKVEEAYIAFQLENKYDKQEILEMYLNQIYFGSGAYGVANASKKYFNKNVEDLNLAECALIAGIPKSPNKYSPLNNPDLAIERRNLVLKLMAKEGYITKNEGEEAAKQSLQK